MRQEGCWDPANASDGVGVLFFREQSPVEVERVHVGKPDGVEILLKRALGDLLLLAEVACEHPVLAATRRLSHHTAPPDRDATPHMFDRRSAAL